MTTEALLRVTTPLDLTSSLTSGQCFRWRVDDDGRWNGVVGRNIVRLTAAEGGLRIESSPTASGEMTEAMAAYLRLDDDLLAIQQRIGWDEHVQAGIEMYPAMHLLAAGAVGGACGVHPFVHVQHPAHQPDGRTAGGYVWRDRRARWHRAPYVPVRCAAGRRRGGPPPRAWLRVPRAVPGERRVLPLPRARWRSIRCARLRIARL